MSIIISPSKRYFDLSDLADGLGMSIITLRRHIRSGKIKAYKVGRKYMVSSDDLERFIEAKEQVESQTLKKRC